MDTPAVGSGQRTLGTYIERRIAAYPPIGARLPYSFIVDSERYDLNRLLLTGRICFIFSLAGELKL